MKESRKDIISMRDLSKEEIIHILNCAKDIEDNPNSELLKGRVVSTLFFEPSTRTRLSFWSAAQRLGAQVLGFDSPDGTSAKKGETLSDTIRMAASYSDVIVMRHPHDGAARLAAEELSDQIGNGCKLRLIDTLNASLAQGILAIYASIMRGNANLNRNRPPLQRSRQQGRRRFCK